LLPSGSADASGADAEVAVATLAAVVSIKEVAVAWPVDDAIADTTASVLASLEMAVEEETWVSTDVEMEAEDALTYEVVIPLGVALAFDVTTAADEVLSADDATVVEDTIPATALPVDVPAAADRTETTPKYAGFRFKSSSNKQAAPWPENVFGIQEYYFKSVTNRFDSINYHTLSSKSQTVIPMQPSTAKQAETTVW
jgi:hypothetical protein